MSIGYGGDLNLGFLSGSLRGMEERAKDAFAGVVREPSAPGSFVASAVQLSVRNFPSEKQNCNIIIYKILQIFGGLVLGCIKTNFCKKICVRQHFSSSTRLASFCTAAISTFSQKIGLKKQQFSWISAKKCKCRKICKICQILSNFKNFSLRIW